MSENAPPIIRRTAARQKGDSSKPHVVVSGYYGFDNLGDELILRVLTDALKARGAAVTVLSANPAKTARLYGVDAVSRMSIPDVVSVLSRAHLFISGGGGLFQDVTGPMSAIYYGGLIHLAGMFKVPVCFWAQGVGPITGKIARFMTASALRQCDAIIVRDEKSASLVSDLVGFRPAVSADPVWLLTSPLPSSEFGPSQDNKIHIGLSLRIWLELTDNRLRTLAKALAEYAVSLERPVSFHLLPFQGSEDTELLNHFERYLRRHLSGSPHEREIRVHTPDEAMTEVSRCDLLIGMRFHSLILGLLFGIRVYGIPYDPKVATLLETFNLQGCAVDQLDDLSAKSIKDAMTGYPSVNLTPLQKQSQRNLVVLDDLLAITQSAWL